MEIEGVKYLDGGLVDCIPLQHFQKIGYERNIVIFMEYGIVYLLTNPVMHGLVKIGMTTQEDIEGYDGRSCSL